MSKSNLPIINFIGFQYRRKLETKEENNNGPDLRGTYSFFKIYFNENNHAVKTKSQD